MTWEMIGGERIGFKMGEHEFAMEYGAKKAKHLPTISPNQSLDGFLTYLLP